MTRRLFIAFIPFAVACMPDRPVPLRDFARRPGCYTDSTFTVYGRFTPVMTAVPFTKVVVRYLTDNKRDTVTVLTPLGFIVADHAKRLKVRSAPEIAGLLLGPSLEIVTDSSRERR